jgi:hypothetical protein
MNKAKRKIDKLMTEPTNTDKARYVAERLGLCWHEPMAEGSQICGKCGNYFDFTEDVSEWNPTFLDPAGRIQLLELMKNQEVWYPFFVFIGSIPTDSGRTCVPLFYLLDDTGLLLDAAYQFLKEKEGYESTNC